MMFAKLPWINNFSFRYQHPLLGEFTSVQLTTDFASKMSLAGLQTTVVDPNEIQVHFKTLWLGIRLRIVVHKPDVDCLNIDAVYSAADIWGNVLLVVLMLGMVGRLESLLFWFMGIGVGLLVGLVLALAAWIGAKGVFRHIELLQLLDAENLYSSQQEQWSVAPLNCPACGASLTPYHGNCPDCDLLVNKHPKDFPVSTSSNQGYNFRYNYKKK